MAEIDRCAPWRSTVVDAGGENRITVVENGGDRQVRTLEIDRCAPSASARDTLGEELERLREELARVREQNTRLRTELEEIRGNYLGVTAAERCRYRLRFESEAERYARDNRDLTLGEQVLRNPLIRDLSLQGLNPYKLSDLQSVLGLRKFYKLLPDVDLKECYFEGAWQFRKCEFVLANWQVTRMTVEQMKSKVRGAHPKFGARRVYPPGKVNVDKLRTKEEIVRAFWELTYVPVDVYMTAVVGAHVLRLRSVWYGAVGRNPDQVKKPLQWACRAGLEVPVIRRLAERCRLREVHIDTAVMWAALGGHTDVVDLLAGEFRARIDVNCLTWAARNGHDAMIDHLVERYGIDPNVADGGGRTALHWAAAYDRVRTVKHLVEKHNVDIHKMDSVGRTATT